MTRIHRKHLLAGVSAAAFSTFVSMSAIAADLDSSGSNAANDGSDTVTSNAVILTNAITDTVTLNSANDLTVSTGGAITGAGAAGLTTSGNTTTATDVTVNSGRTVTADANNIAIDLNNSIGTLTNSGSITAPGTGAALSLATGISAVVVNNSTGVITGAAGKAIDSEGDLTASITNKEHR